MMARQVAVNHILNAASMLYTTIPATLPLTTAARILSADMAVRSTRIVIIAMCLKRAALFSVWTMLYDERLNVQMPALNPLIRCLHFPPTAGGGLSRGGSSSGKYPL
jgi:hypothetical protein